jgi:hypothetical protein
MGKTTSSLLNFTIRDWCVWDALVLDLCCFLRSSSGHCRLGHLPTFLTILALSFCDSALLFFLCEPTKTATPTLSLTISVPAPTALQITASTVWGFWDLISDIKSNPQLAGRHLIYCTGDKDSRHPCDHGDGDDFVGDACANAT